MAAGEWCTCTTVLQLVPSREWIRAWLDGTNAPWEPG